MSSQRHRRLDIIPDGFCDAWGGDSVEEALERAERARSSTDHRSFKRCPGCFSVKVRRKPGHKPLPNKKDNFDYKCGECGHHFATPAPSINEIVEREFSELTESLSDASSNANALAAALRRREER